MKLYKKIHLHLRGTSSREWFYLCSTNQSKTCREARAKLSEKFPQLPLTDIRANWSKD